MKWWILATYYIVSTAAHVEYAEHEVYNDTIGLPESTNWITVANFDLTEGDDCPSPLNKTILSNGMSMCQTSVPELGCLAVKFSVGGKKYNKTSGSIRGYQKGTTDGFRASHDDNWGINEAYVDGVSITIGDNRRKHVWTYAAGFSAEENKPTSNCPCSVTRGPDPPTFVGGNYYCQSGSRLIPDQDTYYMSPLWQGNGCTNKRDNCCGNIGAPMFLREFPTPQNEDIEVRICCNQPLSDEAVLIDQLLLRIHTTE